MASFKIQDNFLTEQEYEELTTLHIEYSKVHWIGLYALEDTRKNKPLNQLHKLVKRIEPEQEVLGATAWYNIRPPRPKPHNDIDSYCTDRDIQWSASPWDLDSLEFLNQYDIPFIKIPSALITNLELLKATAETGKKIIISTNIIEIGK